MHRSRSIEGATSTSPPYNPPKLHRLLKERGILEHALVVRGYTEVLGQAASKPAVVTVA